MPVTVASVFTRVRRAFNDASDTVLLEYAQEVNDDIFTELDIKQDTEDISLAAGTIEYVLDEDIRKVLSAELRKSATDIRPLRAIGKSQLKGAWRDGPRGDPGRFYTAGNSSGTRVVGFTPTPITTTSGGYPIVRLYVTRTSTLTALGNLPLGMRSSDVYVFGINRRLCADSKRDEEAYWHEKYLEQLAKERALFWSQNVDSPPSMIPPMSNAGPV